MLLVQGVTYLHPDKDVLFSDINFVVNRYDKIALIGNNGSGKSTLLRLMAGHLPVYEGRIVSSTDAYYLPQIFGQYNSMTVAEALGVAEKFSALQKILAGDVSEKNLEILDDDWELEDRCKNALANWQMIDINLHTKMSALSGGQKTKLFLAGIEIQQPELVLMDEPSNHLDQDSRNLLYQYIRSTNDTIVVVSHDRSLLNLVNRIVELSPKGLKNYGGNFDFYLEQKAIESSSLIQSVQNKEKELRKARDIERESAERKQKLDARGKKKQEKAGLPTISMNTLRNNAEKSSSRLKDVHAGKVKAVADDLESLRKSLPELDKMKIGFTDSSLHTGKILISAKELRIGYGVKMLNTSPINLEIRSGDRVAFLGSNGSGKTTLIRTLLGEMPAMSGELHQAAASSIYVDQDYSLIQNEMTVFEQALRFNTGLLLEHEIKIRLNRFLFTKEYWNRPGVSLSGGEKMRLMLCCLTLGADAPDIIVLDEPTNNLDMQNVEILTSAINEYRGTLLVISHDEHFIGDIGITSYIDISPRDSL